MGGVLYRVETQGQIDLYRDAFLVGIRNIIAEQSFFPTTPDQLLSQLSEYVSCPTNGLWIVLDRGRLVCWASAKVYHDGPADAVRKTVSITYAWAAPDSGVWSPVVMVAIEEWAKAEGAYAVYCTRQTRIPAFARLMRRYGWHRVAVAFGKDFRQESNGVLADLSLIHI